MICDWKHKGEVWVEFVFLDSLSQKRVKKIRARFNLKSLTPVGEIGSEVERLGLSFRSCFFLYPFWDESLSEDAFLCFQSEKMICDWKHKGEVWVEFVLIILSQKG